MKKINVKNRKVILFGCGAVGKCVLHYLTDFFDIDLTKVYVIEKSKKELNFPSVDSMVVQGVNFINIEICRDNIERILGQIGCKPHDIVIDLTTRTPTYIILTMCRKMKLLYINTSIEDDVERDLEHANVIDDSIFMQHMNILDITKKTAHYGNTTSIIEFGMNPGLISVFIKYGIKDLAEKVIEFQLKKKKVNKELVSAYKKKDISRLAELLKIRTVHCSEIDTQNPGKLDKNIKFFNTWSCLGLIDEGIEPSEIALGTHEEILPFDPKDVYKLLPQLILASGPGYKNKFYSYVPHSIDKSGKIKFVEIEGSCIHHGEGISMNRHIGRDIYAPTMHYAYQLCPLTTKLLEQFTEKEIRKIGDGESWKVMNMYENELEGSDNVGALFILEEDPFVNTKKPYAYWTGSILHSDYTKNILKDPFFGPTVIQVMAGVLSGISYAIENDDQGIIFGEDIDDEYIVSKIKPYLGTFYSGPVSGVKIRGYTLDKLIVKGRRGSTKVRTM